VEERQQRKKGDEGSKGIKERNFVYYDLNKKFWKELICLLSLHYLTMLYE
jgi:hypothetical protein